jgi:ProP effector
LTPEQEKRRAEIRHTRLILNAAFPNAFKDFGEVKVPLQIGITNVVYDRLKPTVPGISRRLLSMTLSNYTAGYKYLQAVVEGATRVDIDGEPAGVVTAREAANAIEVAKRRRAAEKSNRIVQANKKGNPNGI